MANNAAPTKTYRGNCHCGNFIYTITVPEITSVSACDCSYCFKRGVLWSAVPDPADDFKVVKGDEDKDLTLYQFGSKNLSHKFCKRCGSVPFVRWPAGPAGKQLLINTRCLQDLDVWEITSKTFPGSTVGDPFRAPTYDGPQPTSSDLKNPETYHGSCHCGDVKLAFKTDPITEDTRVLECNCSICKRNGYIWIYPKKEHVAITGIEALTFYSHGRRVFTKSFCSRCGVPLQNIARDLSSDELSTLSKDFVNFYTRAKAVHPINMRVLDDFDFSDLKPQRSRAGEALEPKYVNP